MKAAIHASFFGLLSQTASSASFAFTSGFPAFDEFDVEEPTGFEAPSFNAPSFEAPSLKMKMVLEEEEQEAPWSYPLDMLDICGFYTPEFMNGSSCVSSYDQKSNNYNFYETMIVFQPTSSYYKQKAKWGWMETHGIGTCENKLDFVESYIEYGWIKPDFRPRGNVVVRSTFKQMHYVPDVSDRQQYKKECGCGYADPKIDMFVIGRKCRNMNTGKNRVPPSHPDYCDFPMDVKHGIAADKNIIVTSEDWPLGQPDKDINKDALDDMKVDVIFERLPSYMQRGICGQEEIV